jgi:hypothetical protein
MIILSHGTPQGTYLIRSSQLASAHTVEIWPSTCAMAALQTCVMAAFVPSRQAPGGHDLRLLMEKRSAFRVGNYGGGSGPVSIGVTC